MDPEPLERRLDQRRASAAPDRPSSSRERGDVVAVVAVLGRLLAAADGLDGGAKPVHLAAGVVVVVLALDRVAGEREQPRDAVAVGAVPRRRDRDRAGRIGRDHLDLDALRRRSRAAAEARRPPRAPSPGSAANQASSSSRLTNPGPATDAAGNAVERRCGCARAPRRSRAAAALAGRRAGARRSSRSRRGRGPRALERDGSAGGSGQARRELLDGVSQRRASPGAKSCLEASDLVGGADADQHVAGGEHGVGRRGRHERARPAADRDDHGAGRLADPKVADRAAGGRARRPDRDLLEAELVRRRRSRRCRGSRRPAA